MLLLVPDYIHPKTNQNNIYKYLLQNIFFVISIS